MNLKGNRKFLFCSGAALLATAVALIGKMSADYALIMSFIVAGFTGANAFEHNADAKKLMGK